MGNIRKHINRFLFKSFPQNFLVEKPYAGTVVFFVVSFVFVMIYRPLEVQESGSLGFSFTVLVYLAIISIFELVTSVILSRTNGFRPKGNWTVANEIISILIILSAIGISAYLSGFIMEPAGPRWNLPTFLDSFSRAILVGLIPVVLPSLLNVRYAFARETFQNYEVKDKPEENREVLINIESKAKKEHLDFYPGEFIYAESSGNYVVFHLMKQGKQVDVTIRNSISEIEKQLSDFPTFMRTHRAFIVNLKKITSRKGNALGYQLTLSGQNNKVPVSRQNARKFEQVME